MGQDWFKSHPYICNEITCSSVRYFSGFIPLVLASCALTHNSPVWSGAPECMNTQDCSVTFEHSES